MTAWGLYKDRDKRKRASVDKYCRENRTHYDYARLFTIPGLDFNSEDVLRLKITRRVCFLTVTMPKGFLIKRSKKAGPVSYRMREEDLALVANCSPLVENAPAHAQPSVCHNFIRVPSRVIFGGMSESHCAPSLSPTRPDSEGYQYPPADAAHQMLSSLSPAPADTFPEANLGSFAIDGSPVSPSLPEMTTRLDTMCGNAKYAAEKRPAFSNARSPHTNSKKCKSSSSPNQEKKSSVRHEVTTSPVLGLRITEEAEDEVKQRSNTSSPLGEFICQLCKERYADPLTLAFHKCSRIVRVEYRCDECDKVFSCPANLASHRRWHKPKGFQVERVSSQREESRPHTPTARYTLPPSTPPSDSGSDEEMMFSCPQCSKKFRKQAYLRKHLALHNRKAASHPQNQTPSSPLAIVTDQQHSCPLESGRESPQPSTKYAGTERITKVTGEVFPCRFCGDNFFSSPGLTRHINKYHPTEHRQVIVLS
ncbi:insulinoma-associated protein 1a-like [Oncorhynchus masou masou]|uniref:insulinoma-associated protein 1a-like n=1 Tax=Oncorhynchus masou masou TaxID=90313 RepID=UPI0031836331